MLVRVPPKEHRIPSLINGLPGLKDGDFIAGNARELHEAPLLGAMMEAEENVEAVHSAKQTKEEEEDDDKVSSLTGDSLPSTVIFPLASAFRFGAHRQRNGLFRSVSPFGRERSHR